MQNILTIDNELRLCSNMDELSFGKTNYDSIVSQEGFIFDGKNFSVWNFDDVKSFDIEGKTERIVFYCGKNPLSENAKTLLDYFSEGGENLYKAVMVVCEALTSAAKNKNKIPMNGAGGILVDLSLEKVLFLPEDLFKYSVTGLSKEDYLLQNGGWINETLNGLPALCFERAVLIFRLLTNRLPFPAADTIERNADILDNKFLPLELSINGIDESLSKEINRSLKLTSNAVNIPGKKKKGKSSEDLTPTADFPLELIPDAYKLSKQQSENLDKEFEEKAESYLKAQHSKISAKRNFRRNSTAIFAAVASAIVLVIIIINTVKTKQSEYTSRGLTSVETIQSYLWGMNKKETTLLTNITKGKKVQGHVDAVGQVYVLDKQRKAYGRDNGFAYPENWLFYATDEIKYRSSGIYGVTNVKIDEKPFELDVKIYQKNENPEPITKEGNIEIHNKDESVHKVQYYLIRSEGEDNAFFVEDVIQVFTLLYKKDRWLITDISTSSVEIPVKCNTFKNDYFNQLAMDDGDVVNAVKTLKKKYYWLPTEKAMMKERDLLVYQYLHPFDNLGL